MTLLLEQGTKPNGLKVKTWGFGQMKQSVFMGDYEISVDDFLTAAFYVLTNTDLTGPDDPRLKFVETVKQMTEVDGFNGSGKRLDSPLESFKVF